MEFTTLERAALLNLIGSVPEFTAALLRQLESARVISRENTGAGFFTTISVGADVEAVSSPRVLDNETYARIVGLTYGMGFILFMEKGRLSLLEGFSCGGEDTSRLRLDDLDFLFASTPFDA